MKKSSAVIMAFAALACGCTMEIRPDAPMAEKTVFTVSAPSTRTVVGDATAGSRQLYWADGDCLTVNGIASEALSGVPSESTNASFTVNGALTAPYDAVYPASIWKDASTVTLPATAQNGVLPLGGRSNDSELALSPLTSCLHLVLKQSGDASPDTHQIAYVEISTESVRMNGDFTVDFENAGLTPAAGASADECKVRVAGPWDLPASGALDLFVPVPAGTYSFSVKILDVKGHFMTVSTTGSKNMDKGVIKAFPAIEFKPTGTQFDVVITSASDLVTFAQEYNSKAYESLGSDLKVCLDQDITFDTTTSADFNSTGGIGLKTAAGDTEDFYFSGLFDGQGHTIAGLAATVPVFKATQDASTVKDLTVDGSCSFTFTHPNTAEAMFGSVVGYHKGVLDNVKVAADISLAAVADVTKMTTLGGLAGRTTTGKLQNGCEYSGLISTPVGFETSGKLIIGGLVGRFSNAGSISDSFFKGAISNYALVSSTDKTNPYLIIGGAVGFLDGGATVSSTNSTADHEEVATGHSTLKGRIVISTTTAYNSALGGIVGELQKGNVSDCTNAATLSCYIVKTGDASARYIKNGGIAGKVNADGIVTDCINNGAINHRANPRLQDLGGIAGYNAGSVSGCTNNAAVNHMTSGASGAANKGGRIVNIAGVIGENASGSVVSDVHNTADIQISAIEDNYDKDNNKPVCEIRMGGVIAYNLEEIDGGASKNITNSGNVNLTTTPQNPFIGFELGGVVGYSEKSVKNVVNSGTVENKLNQAYAVTKLYMGGIVGETKNGTDMEISGCNNSGEVYFNVNNKSASHTDNYIGGIIGIVSDANVAINGCNNSGYIHGGNPTKVNGTTFYTGGIVAFISGASSITNCNNTGVLLNNHFNNNNTKAGSTFEGGIAGFVLGTDSKHITVSNVTNNVNSGGTITGGRRGYTGGIVGYGEYTDIDGATNANNYGSGSGYWIGGIAGWLVNSTVSNSTYSGTAIETSQVQGAGGIVCVLDAGSTIDGCNSYLSSITHGSNACVDGAIAGKSVAGSTISNCHYTTAFAICSDANFTDGGGNVSDL